MTNLILLVLAIMSSLGYCSKAYIEVDLNTVLSVNNVTTVGHVFGLT